MIRKYVWLVTWILMFGFVGVSNASIITQKFSNSWNINVWNYYGDVSAMEWQYQPYLSSLYNLESVELSFDIAVSNLELGDDFRYRISFFTGWSPSSSQFSDNKWFYNVTSKDLIINKTFLFTYDYNLEQWQTPLYGPNGHYYFESKSLNNSHTVNVNTELTYNYTDVPEPSTLAIFALGMIGLVSRRFKKH